MARSSLLLALFLLWSPINAVAQEHHSHSDAIEVEGTTADAEMDMSDDAQGSMDEHSGHSESSDVIGLPHGRHGSGTSWMPDSSPTYMTMWEKREWEWMLHGVAHFSYIEMSGPRGDSGVYGPNWLMLKGMHRIGCDEQLELSGMFSLDPFTVGGEGYPLLFQTGETWQGLPLHDRQHPHNALAELSIKYKWRLNCNTAAYVYAAPVGEPALGPPAFMHRQIALEYPLSPLGHHWQDATHIAYGVVTAGLQSREWQLEGSVFNGREPGEDRFAIESPTFDSYSSRLTWNPGRNVSMQVSQGKLKSPEALHPNEDVTRSTASLIYNHDLGCGRNWQTVVGWGRNRLGGEGFDSYLVESSLKQDGSWSPYFRYERIDKNAEELVLPDPPFEAHDRFHLQQGTVGATVDLGDKGHWQWGLGAAYTFNIAPSELTPEYGNDPAGWTVYLRAHPRRMEHSGHSEHGMDHDMPEHSESESKSMKPGEMQMDDSHGSETEEPPMHMHHE